MGRPGKSIRILCVLSTCCALTALHSAAAAGCDEGRVGSFGQCGGKGYIGSFRCGEPGEVCVQKNAFYSQCLDPTTRDIPVTWSGDILYCDPEAASYSPSAPVECEEGCTAAGAQCGGLGFVGFRRCCDLDEKCFVQDDSFSQCMKPEDVPADWNGAEAPCASVEQPAGVAPRYEVHGQIASAEDNAYTLGDEPLTGMLELTKREQDCSEGEAVGPYEACGGKHHEGGNSCSDPSFHCVEKDQYFAQCLPIARAIEAGWIGDILCRTPELLTPGVPAPSLTLQVSPTLQVDPVGPAATVDKDAALSVPEINANLAGDLSGIPSVEVDCTVKCVNSHAKCYGGNGVTNSCCDPKESCVQTGKWYGQCRSRAISKWTVRKCKAKSTQTAVAKPVAPSNFAADEPFCAGTGFKTALGPVCIIKPRKLEAGAKPPAKAPDNSYIVDILHIYTERWYWVRENGVNARATRRPRAWYYVVDTRRNYAGPVTPRDQDSADRLGEAMFQAQITLQLVLDQRSVSWRIKALVRRMLQKFEWNQRFFQVPEYIAYKGLIDYNWNTYAAPHYRFLATRPLYHEKAGEDMFDTLLHEMSHYMKGANEENWNSMETISTRGCKDPPELPYYIVDNQHTCVFHNIFYTLLDVAWKAGQLQDGAWLETADAPAVSKPRTRPEGRPPPIAYYRA